MEERRVSDLNEIRDKVTECLAVVKQHIVMTEERLNRQKETLDMHSKEIWGEGPREPGIKTELDRLIQTEKSRKVALAAVSTATVGLVAKAIYSLFQR